MTNGTNKNSTTGLPNKRKLSRRSTLKLAGSAAVVSAFAHSAANVNTVSATTDSTLDKQLTQAAETDYAYVSKSPLAYYAVERLRAMGFDLELDRLAYMPVATKDTFVGLRLDKLNNVKWLTRRLGLEVVFTVNSEVQSVTGLQLLSTCGMESLLLVTSEILDPASLIPIEIQLRGGSIVIPTNAHMQSWTFLRDAKDILPLPERLPEIGTPLDDPNATRWEYEGCLEYQWRNVAGISVFTCIQLAESLSTNRAQSRTVVMSYDLKTSAPF
jgi:hypothetical protein